AVRQECCAPLAPSTPGDINVPQVILPAGWKRPVGYANGILAGSGRTLYLSGQVGWDADQTFQSEELVPQFAQALRIVLAIVHAAGGRPSDICRITAFCIDKRAYLAG